MAYIISSGITSDGIILEEDSMTVLDGGIVINTAISGNYYGDEEVWGYIINHDYVRAGGLTVSSGGIANRTTVKKYGYLTVSSGGTATEIIENGGYVDVQDGAIVTFVSNTFSGLNIYLKSATLHSGTTANGNGVYHGGSLIVCGGTANNTRVNGFGTIIDQMRAWSSFLYVYSGGIANKTTINLMGSMHVSSGGTANSTTLNGGFTTDGAYVYSFKRGCLYVSNGGTANNTTVNSGGELYVLSGGTANSTTLNGSYVIFEQYGGWESNYRYNMPACMFVSSAGVANSTTVNSGGSMTVYSSGPANSTTVNNGGAVYVSSGGIANIAFNPWMGSVASEEGATVTYLERDANVYVGNNTSGLITTTNAISGQNLEAGISAIVYSGGTVNSTTLSGGGLVVSSGGVANSTTVSGGELYVSSGGTATNILASDGTWLYLAVAPDTFVQGNSGGGAFEITDAVLSDFSLTKGHIEVMENGKANGITVNPGCRLAIASGGTAMEIVENGGYVDVQEGADVTFVSTILSGLTLSYTSTTVHSGTTANSTQINYRATLIICGGTANSTTVNGNLQISSDGVANSTTVNASGYLHISSGGAANSTTVNEWGSLCVSSGGTANITTINSRGTLIVSDGGTANSTSVISLGKLYVSSGGTANNTSMVHGNLYVSSGGTAINTTISNGGIDVSSGGVANNNMILYGGVDVFSGGVINDTVFDSGWIRIRTGGTANRTIINGGWSVAISSGGTANSTTVNAGGNLTIMSGGTASIVFNPWMGSVASEEGATVTYLERVANVYVGNTISGVISKTNAISDLNLDAGISAIVYSGGTANSTTVNELGMFEVSSGGVANSTTVNELGMFEVSSGGTATEIIENGGYVDVADGAIVSFASNTFSGLVLSASATVHSGTTANNTTVNTNGFLYVLGGTVNSATVNAGGGLAVSSGGTVNSAKVNTGGRLHVFGGGIANRTTVSSGGQLFVSQGGTADSATIYGNGELNVLGGGTAANARTYAGGTVKVSSGGRITGRMNFAMGTVVSMEDGAVVDFDLTQATPEGKALLSDWSLIQGTPDYTITVDGNQAGVYVLADNAEDFEGTITVTGLSGESLGTVALDESVLIGDTAYTLNLNGSTLTLAVLVTDMTAPTVSGVRADITALTNRDVTVTAVFEDNIELAASLYRIGEDGEWTPYVDGATATENTTVYFKAVDASGNESEIVPFRVDNIDKAPPSDPSGLKALRDEQDAMFMWNACTDDRAGLKEYVVRYSNGSREYTVRTDNTSLMVNDLASGTWNWRVQAVDNLGNASPAVPGKSFTMGTVVPEPVTGFTPECDIDGNGISDVMFQWTGGDQQIGFWMNGTNEWQGQGRSRSDAWNVLGGYDMNADGKADMLMIGKDSFLDMTGTYIGYYDGAVDVDDNWHTVGFLVNANDWVNKVGNLTGNDGANSIVWYAPELYALGAWTDGTDNWTGISNSFGGDDWTLIGCGDFDGDGRDSIMMAYNGGQLFYTADIDGTTSEMGDADWSGWEVRAIGDFKGDGKDDLVLFHKETGSMVMIADGRTDEGNYISLDQLSAKDWFVVGCGDYDGDQKDDLLVRQYSTGMLGYYASGDTQQWNVLGYGVDMSWTVIA